MNNCKITNWNNLPLVFSNHLRVFGVTSLDGFILWAGGVIRFNCFERCNHVASIISYDCQHFVLWYSPVLCASINTGFYTLCIVRVGDLVKSQQYLLCFIFHSAKKACTNCQKWGCKSFFGPYVQPNCYFASCGKPLCTFCFSST